MSSKTLTNWELSDEQKIEQFYQETLEYMIVNLPHVNIFNGYINSSCGYDHFSYEYEEKVINPLERFDKFCESKGYSPRESLDILVNHTDKLYNCDCDFPLDVESTPRLEKLINKHHPE